MNLNDLIKQEVEENFNKTFRYGFGKLMEGSLELTHNNVRNFLEASLTRTVKAVIEEMRLGKEIPGMAHPSKCDGECVGKPHFSFNRAVHELETKIKTLLS